MLPRFYEDMMQWMVYLSSSVVNCANDEVVGAGSADEVCELLPDREVGCELFGGGGDEVSRLTNYQTDEPTAKKRTFCRRHPSALLVGCFYPFRTSD